MTWNGASRRGRAKALDAAEMRFKFVWRDREQCKRQDDAELKIVERRVGKSRGRRMLRGHDVSSGHDHIHLCIELVEPAALAGAGTRNSANATVARMNSFAPRANGTSSAIGAGSG